jgi:inorganic pyrophosphatase
MSEKLPVSKYQLHPWHGVAAGDEPPDLINVFVEILPTDVMKYEVDKISGHLKVDRPQKYSSQYPTLYGFIPQTYCGDRVGGYASEQTGRPGIRGDGDPLDICVLTERPIQHGGILLRAKPVGGLRVLDRNEADDKIFAVLHGDGAFGDFHDLSDFPEQMIDRLRHFFLTYKVIPGEEAPPVEISGIYGAEEARRVITLSMEDYSGKFGSSPR